MAQSLNFKCAAQVEVFAGKHNLFIEEPQQQVANVQVGHIFWIYPPIQFFLKLFEFILPSKAIKIHPNWDAGSMEADICLIELESSFELNSAVGSARWPFHSCLLLMDLPFGYFFLLLMFLSSENAGFHYLVKISPEKQLWPGGVPPLKGGRLMEPC